MGVRSYIPQLGRFASVDPVQGGSANDYDYTNADPVNQLDLDGRYPYYGQANRSEKWFCAAPWRIARCRTAFRLSRRATAATRRVWGRSGVGDRSDAYRHCYWSGLMTFYLGAQFAKDIGDRHERVRNNRDGRMDLHNNFWGRRFALQRRGLAPHRRAGSLSSACIRGSRRGGPLAVMRR